MSDTQITELKECPFCGGEAQLFPKDRDNPPYQRFYDVRCVTKDCYLEDGADYMFDTKGEAVAKWNTRAARPGQKEIRDKDLKILGDRVRTLEARLSKINEEHSNYHELKQELSSMKRIYEANKGGAE